MDTETLLLPRYKVIADYPLSACKVGEILIPDKNYGLLPVIQGGYWQVEIENYPHLFRKLQWWEERDKNDMPKYVKSTEYGKRFHNGVFKVDKYNSDGVHLRIEKNGDSDAGVISWFLPATQTEYFEYQKQPQT